MKNSQVKITFYRLVTFQLDELFFLKPSKDRYGVKGDRWTCIPTCPTGQVIPKVNVEPWHGNFNTDVSAKKKHKKL